MHYVTRPWKMGLLKRRGARWHVVISILQVRQISGPQTSFTSQLNTPLLLLPLAFQGLHMPCSFFISGVFPCLPLCQKQHFSYFADHYSFFFFFFLRFLFIFREGKGGREGEKHQYMVVSHAPPTGDLAHKSGMCPDWEANRQPFGSRADTQSTELHQPGRSLFIL